MCIKKILFLISLVIASACGLSSSEFRTFTDVKGRQMEAKLTRVSGEDIYIERKDGLDTKVKLSIFSEEDQEYIKGWARDQLLENGVFDVRFGTKRSSKNEYTNGGIIYDKYNMQYEVVITNKNYDNDFENIRVEYLVLKFEDKLAADKRREGRIERIKGVVTHDVVKARGEVRLSTEKFPMMTTKLAQGYVWRGGGERESKDIAKGIWVKVYVGDKLVHEISKPENMMRKEPWG